MAFRSSLRPLSLAARSSITASRGFHFTRPAFVSVGDSIPNLDVVTEGSPSNQVNLAKEFASSNGIIIGVPGAFSTLSLPAIFSSGVSLPTQECKCLADTKNSGPGCSQKHIPSYLTHPNIKDAGKVFVVSVNDAFVMKAWGDALDPSGTVGVSARPQSLKRCPVDKVPGSSGSLPTRVVSSPRRWALTSTPPKSLATSGASGTLLWWRTAR